MSYKVLETLRRGDALYALAAQGGNDLSVFKQKGRDLVISNFDGKGTLYLTQTVKIGDDGIATDIAYHVAVPAGKKRFDRLADVRVVHRPKQARLAALIDKYRL